MQSTSTSKEPLIELKPDEILRVEKLNLIFKSRVYRSSSFRDAFTRAVHDPIGSVLNVPDRLHILKDISFTLKRGTRLGLLGVNGTGKSSLCRCIAGVYHPNSGAVKVKGRVQGVFDTAMGIIPELTGRENAELLVQFLYPDFEKDHKEIVREALEFSELRKFADVAFKFYSNGMMSRLYLSLISSRPVDLMILDEVFEGADAFFREKVSKRVENLISSSGACIFVSHSFGQIQRVCNRLIVLDSGRIAYDGDVDEGIEFYQNSNLKHDL